MARWMMTVAGVSVGGLVVGVVIGFSLPSR
jgi:hypothetical protein